LHQSHVISRKKNNLWNQKKKKTKQIERNNEKLKSLHAAFGLYLIKETWKLGLRESEKERKRESVCASVRLKVCVKRIQS